MCRLTAFFGSPICAADLVTRPARSIIQQSFDARERMSGDASTPGYLNGDGFGLGWYGQDPKDPLPCVYRQARPAWNDGNLAMIAEKIHSHIIFAHVRAASPGMDVSETTCHPFRFGRLCFMHNGGVGGFHAVRRILLPTLKDTAFDFAVTNGSSDSALCFAVFLNEVPDPMEESTPCEMRDRLDRTIIIIRDAIFASGTDELSLLNFVISDGDSLMASRVVVDPKNPDAQAASLYHASGNSFVEDASSPGDYHMVHVDRRPSIAIVSSEPLTEYRNDWIAVPKNHILVFTSSMHILQSEVSRSNAAISRMLANLGGTGRQYYHTIQPSSFQSAPPLFSGDPPFLPSAPSSPSPTGAHLPDIIGLRSSSATDSSSGATGFARRESILRRAISSRQMSHQDGGEGLERIAAPLLAATPGPSSSTIRYSIETEDHCILSMVVCGEFLCSGAHDGSIRVWHIEDRMEVAVLHKHISAVMSLITDADAGVLVSGSADSQIGIWSMKEPNCFECLRLLSCSGCGDVLSVTFVHRFIYAGFSDSVMRRLDEDIDSIAAKGRQATSAATSPVQAPMKFESAEESMPLSPMPALRIGGGQAEDASFDREMSSERLATLVSEYSAMAPRIRRGDKAALGRDRKLSNASLNRQHDGGEDEWAHYGYVFALKACFDGRLLCTGCGDGFVRVWDVASGECIRALEGHTGAVLALTITTVDESTLLFSGSRDGTLKVWDCGSGFLCKRTIRIHKSEVVTCVSSTDVVLSGSSDGQVYLWCARTLHCMAQFKNESLQAASVSVSRELLFLATGTHIQVRDMQKAAGYAVNGCSKTADATASAFGSVELDGNGGPVLEGVEAEKREADECHVAGLSISGSGGEDDQTPDPGLTNGVVLPRTPPDADREKRLEERLLQDVLARFISFPTVSGHDHRLEDCWKAAKYLTGLLEGMGASVKMIAPDPDPASSADVDPGTGGKPAGSKGRNPIVLARFKSTKESAPTLTFYGHYDVMPAGELEDWNTDPWTLSAVGGHYYGRGTTDNKGPILAMVFAIKGLLDSSKDGLDVNVVLVLEGEGEQSNSGFRQAVQNHLHWFDGTVMILTSNSYWIGEERPCITYGMRGVVDLNVTVTGGTRNLHSGVDGGAIFEPVVDLVGILSTLIDSHGEALVPGFYDDVRPLTEEDRARLAEVKFELAEYRARTGVEKFTSSSPSELLESRWHRPSVSVSSLNTSNKDNVYSVMPCEASAKVSLRFVPDQDPDELVKKIRSHLEIEFLKRRSRNKLSVACVGKGDWWLGDPSGKEFQLAARAVRSVWGVEPLYVCEGGTMPIFSFLSKTLEAPVVQVPLGQASDAAHLPNERIRAMNLHRGKDVLRFIISELNAQKVKPP